MQVAEQPERSGRKLDSRVSPGDARAAVAAASAQQGIAQERNIVANMNARAAVRAVRGRMRDGLMARQAANADIQKAAKDQPEKHDEDIYEKINVQHLFSFSIGEIAAWVQFLSFHRLDHFPVGVNRGKMPDVSGRKAGDTGQISMGHSTRKMI